MASGIQAAFAKAAPADAGKGRALLIPYLTACWPTPSTFAELLRAMEGAGADIIEVGVPFSDPSADGPVIQRANEEALAAGIGLRQALDAVAEFRAGGGKVPVVLMGYANPFLRHGVARLGQDCAAAGVDGVLAVDWRVAPGDGLGDELAAAAVDRIVLLSPTTTTERASVLAGMGSGYAYYVSIQGVTGAAKLSLDGLAAAAECMRASIGLPLAVGFGVRSPEDCRMLGEHFDAVIVGSHLLETVREAGSGAVAAVAGLVGQMREGLE